MLDTKDCIVYPILQKFYNALSNLERANPNDYIFENIPKIDAFFQEFRNITFVMQKNFNTPELKILYERKRNTYLSSDDMKWFVDIRNETTHENPFKLEKAISLKTYFTVNDFDEFKTLLTIDRDKNLTDLLAEVSNILEEHYKNYLEVFFSISVLFVENGKEIDIYEKIIEGTAIMWRFIYDVCVSYPCSCAKCKNLKTKIKEALNNIQFKQIMFVQDCYYSAGQIQIGDRMNSFMHNNEVFNKKDSRFDLTKSPWFGKDCCDNDILLLQKWSVWYIVLAQMQLQQKKEEPEILDSFLLVYEDNTAEMIGMFAGTVKTTYYRIINEVAERVKCEKIRAVLYTCETIYYTQDNAAEILCQKYDERKKEANGTISCSLIASKQLEYITGIDMDYSKMNDNDYLSNKVKNPKSLGKTFLIGPIFRALKKTA
ncbi:MAG: hypothetical protein LBH98_08775 [Chitinispirillales bacterium]|jgi:hypothetical protein|nr:hypothetical protein [Chitinispirillales bacterium]